jgi:hypothetical protein
MVVRGIVVDEDGAPLPGATVFAVADRTRTVDPGTRIWSDPALAVPVVTDADGRFALSYPAKDATLGLRARAPGHVLIAPASAAWPVMASADAETRIVLRRGVPVRVTVISDATGAPVKGADVQLFYPTGTPLHLVDPLDGDLTDEAGSATVTAPGGNVDLVVEARGFAQAVAWSLVVSPPLREVTIRVRAGGAVNGQVRGLDGGPVVGARVIMLRAPRYRGETRTDAEGRFRFLQVPAASDEDRESRRVLALVCDAEGFGRQQLTAAAPPEGGAIDVSFPLAALRPLEGRIRYPDGSPAAGLKVGYAAESGRPEWGWSHVAWDMSRFTVTGRDGSFRTEPLPPARVGLRAPFDPNSHEPTTTVEFPSAEPIEVVIQPPARSRTVVVLDSAGRRVPKATVMVHTREGNMRSGPATQTDAEGLVRVETPEGGAFTLVVDTPGAGLVVLPVEPGAVRDPIEVRLGAGRIEGRLVRLDGTPARVRLTLERSVGGASWSTLFRGWRGAVEADADGRFRIENVSGGTWRLHVLTEGMRIVENDRNVECDTAPFVRHVITLPEEAALTPVADVVEAGSDAPVPRTTRVVAEPDGGGESVQLVWRSDEKVWRAYGVAMPGAWTIRASAPGFEPAEARVRFRVEGPVERPRLVLRRER